MKFDRQRPGYQRHSVDVVGRRIDLTGQRQIGAGRRTARGRGSRPRARRCTSDPVSPNRPNRSAPSRSARSPSERSPSRPSRSVRSAGTATSTAARVRVATGNGARKAADPPAGTTTGTPDWSGWRAARRAANRAAKAPSATPTPTAAAGGARRDPPTAFSQGLLSPHAAGRAPGAEGQGPRQRHLHPGSEHIEGRGYRLEPAGITGGVVGHHQSGRAATLGVSATQTNRDAGRPSRWAGRHHPVGL